MTYSKQTTSILLIGILSLFIGSMLVSCSGRDIDENDPASLYREAEEDISNDHYQLALDKLRTVKNKFPYSKLAVDAQLRIADVYFLQESFGEAAISYETFRDLHPKHEKTPYAMYRIALSYQNDSPSIIARDLTPAQKSLTAYQEFTQKYPDAPEAQAAKKAIVDLNNILAEKELYIAKFYMREDQYDSAKTRFEKLMELYPESTFVPEAKKGLEKATALLEKQKAQNEKQ